MGSNRLSGRGWRFIWIAAAVVVADQLSKYWAVANLTRAFYSSDGAGLSLGEKVSRFLWLEHPLRDRAIPVLENFWHFRYAENPGAAWSFLAGAPDWFRTPFFLVVAVAAMIFIIVYFRKTHPEQTLLQIALAMIFGGALGNFIDRFRLGYVIDFIDWHWYASASWPTFNVADAGITVGVVLMALDMLIHNEPENAGATQNKHAGTKKQAKRAS